MNRSTKHAIAQHLFGLFGFAIFAGPMWFQVLGFIPPMFQLLGLLMIFFGIISGFGLGSWGSYYKKLLIMDNESYLKSLEPKQPWEK